MGAGFTDRNLITMLGSSSNALSLPRDAVFANATTTPPTGEFGMTEGGGTLKQHFSTSGIRKINLWISAVAPTATSSIYVLQQASFDDTNFFNVATSTTDLIATSSVSMLPRAYEIRETPTATSTLTFSVPIDGYPYTRLVIWSEGWTGDADTGVQAWITANLVEDYAR